MQINFEPVHLKKANKKLDKHILSAYMHEKTNKVYKEEVFKKTLWKKIIDFFKKS